MKIYCVWPCGCDVIGHVIRTCGIFQMALKLHFSSLMMHLFVSSCKFFNTSFEKSHYYFFLKKYAYENCSWKVWLLPVRRLLKLKIKRNLDKRFRCILFLAALIVSQYLYRFIARRDVILEITRAWRKVRFPGKPGTTNRGSCVHHAGHVSSTHWICCVSW